MSWRALNEDAPRLRGPYQRRNGLYSTVKQKRKNRKLWWLGLGLVVFFAIAIPACGSYFSTKEHIVTVDSKERVCDRNSDGGMDCKYLIFTDGGTFELTDSLFLLRWNSSDEYGRIKEGKTYRLETYGWRWGCSSSYQNIKSFEEVPPGTT